jgi:hypothetical protein
VADALQGFAVIEAVTFACFGAASAAAHKTASARLV